MCDHFQCFSCNSKISYDEIRLECPRCLSSHVRSVIPTKAEPSLLEKEKSLHNRMLGWAMDYIANHQEHLFDDAKKTYVIIIPEYKEN